MVTSDLPTVPVFPVGDLPHIMGLQLADPDYFNPGRIDILLGADMAPKIMVKALLRDGTDTEPIAQATHFGWVLSGPVRRKHSSCLPVPTNHQAQAAAEPGLGQQLTRFWKSEEPEPEEQSVSVTEQQVEQHYCDSVVYIPSECRYQVTLPRKPDIDTLGGKQTPGPV